MTVRGNRGGVAGVALVAVLLVLGIIAAASASTPASTSSTAPAEPSASTPESASSTAPDESSASPSASVAASPAPSETVTTTSPSETPRPGTALALLETLEVKGRAPKTGYDRDSLFGRAWRDVDSNGCDTRNDILLRDLLDVTVDERCRVLTGVLHDPYTGDQVVFVRGQGTSAEVQIDHVVALMDAWQKGAQQLTETERLRFANDPLNLLAVSGTVNQAKGAGDAATWLPPRKGFRCEYVARQVSVKARYELWVTAAEKEQIQRVLAGCPDEPAPNDGLG